MSRRSCLAAKIFCFAFISNWSNWVFSQGLGILPPDAPHAASAPSLATHPRSLRSDDAFAQLETDVKAIFKARCVRCHKTGVFGADGLLLPEKWDDALTRIHLKPGSDDYDDDHMPPPDAPQLNAEKHEIEKIETWIAFRTLSNNLEKLDPHGGSTPPAKKTAATWVPPVSDVEARKIFSRACSNCHGTAWHFGTSEAFRLVHRGLIFLNNDGSVMANAVGQKKPNLSLGKITSDIEEGTMPDEVPLFESASKGMNALDSSVAAPVRAAWRFVWHQYNPDDHIGWNWSDNLPDEDKQKLLRWLAQTTATAAPAETMVAWNKKGKALVSGKRGAENACDEMAGSHLPSLSQLQALDAELKTKFPKVKGCVWSSTFSGTPEKGGDAVWVIGDQSYVADVGDKTNCLVLCVR